MIAEDLGFLLFGRVQRGDAYRSLLRISRILWAIQTCAGFSLQGCVGSLGFSDRQSRIRPQVKREIFGRNAPRKIRTPRQVYPEDTLVYDHRYFFDSVSHSKPTGPLLPNLCSRRSAKRYLHISGNAYAIFGKDRMV